LQTWRIIGLCFSCSKRTGCCRQCSPTLAGFGDILIGATASLAAWKLAKPRYRNGFAAWQFLGIADLVLAVGTGTLSRLVETTGVSMLPRRYCH